MSPSRRRRRSPARWIAPLALVAAGVAVYAVAHPHTASDGATATHTTTATKPRTTTTTAKHPKKARPRTYVVKSGDTLSAIAGKTGVSLTRIQALNPKLDPGALQTGEKIKLGP